MEIYTKRLEKLKSIMKENHYNAFYTSNITNVRYLSGFTGSSGFLLVSDQGDHFFSDGRYTEQSKNQVHDYTIHITTNHLKMIEEEKLLKSEWTLCFEGNHLSYDTYNRIKGTSGATEMVAENDIVENITNLNLGLDPYIDQNGDPGHFVSEFMAYHGTWYRDLNQFNNIQNCIAAGHIHVGGLVDWNTAHEAVLITVRETIDYIYQNILAPGDVNRDGTINSLDITMILSHLNGSIELTDDQFCFADMDEDAKITIHDVVLLVNELLYDDQ